MTQTTSATRILFSFPLLRKNSPDDRWVNLYYSDMAKNKPVVIVDAVTPTQFKYDLLKDFPIETIPKIRQFVYENYTHVSTIDGVRIFASNKRLQELGIKSAFPI
jgi:hypothetical protein